MGKKSIVYLALALMVLAVIASLPLDFVCAANTWEYPEFEVHVSTIGLGSRLTVWSRLWGLHSKMTYAALISLLAVAGIVAHKAFGRGRNEVAVGLAIALCAVIAISRMIPFAIGSDELLGKARMAVVACYAPLSYVAARMLVSILRPRLALAAHLAGHAALVVFCTWKGAGYALTMSVPTVAWMALCWTVFAAPALLDGAVGAWDARRRAALAVGSVAVQVAVLSGWRLTEIVGSLGGTTGSGMIDRSYDWAIVHAEALVAFPQASYLELVEDPFMLLGLQRIPLAWLGIAGGQLERLAYAALLLLFVGCAFVLWRAARVYGGGAREVLALGVLLSNLWGIACSVLLFASSGVVTLLSGNSYQLVPLACLLAVWLVPGRGGCADGSGKVSRGAIVAHV